MKITVSAHSMRLQSETEAESQVVADVIAALFRPSVARRVDDRILNNHGCTFPKADTPRNFVTLPLP